MADIHTMIATVSPDVYCDSSVRKEVKELIKTKGYLEAAKKAKISNSSSEIHGLTYDSAAEGLEPIYFWIIDFLRKNFKEITKITDNFASSVGSGHFSEQGQKLTRMQEESMKLLRIANEVIRSVINLVYDLKEMKLLLLNYDEVKFDNYKIKIPAMLSLKQRWMDMVDIKRGQGSINALAATLDFATLRDAFMATESVDDIDKWELNDRVKRLLQQRLADFTKWVDESENQLRKRYEIEKKYLRGQVSSLKLYARWIIPYLKAAKQLEQGISGQHEALVTAFNTMILELTIFAKDDYKLLEEIENGTLPQIFKKAKIRKYHPVVIVEFNFRSIPQKVGQHYAFGGRTDIKFTSYALNEHEVKALKEEIEKNDLGEVMEWVHGATTESLGHIQDDIDEFLKEKTDEEKEKKDKEKKKEQDVNPFSSLLEFFSPKKKEKEKEDFSKGIKPDSEYEKVVRKKTIEKASEKCFRVFDTYKKSHGMPSHQSPFES